MTNPSIDPEGLENAAQVFTNRGLYRSSAVIYCKLLAHDRAHGMAWTGLAEALLRLSAAESDVALLELSLRCVRSCLLVDADNFWGRRLEGTIQSCSTLPKERISSCTPLDGDPTALIHDKLSLSVDRLSADLDQVSWEERMLIVVWIASQQDPDFVPLLIHATQDDNRQVQLAALQPLSRWAAQPQVRRCFEGLVDSHAEPIAADLKQALREISAQLPDHAEWAASLTARLP